jgi:hypothetical protein
MANISSSSIAQQIYDLSEEYQFYISVLIMTGGLISNIFIILVLVVLRVFRGKQCAFYLIIECTANTGLLLVIFSSRILAYILNQDPVQLSTAWCKIRSWSTQVFCSISLGTICFATFDQYLSTNYRYSFRQMSTLKLAHRLTFFIVCFAVLHNIPLLILTEIRSTMGCTVYDSVLKNYYSFFYYPILSSSLPLIISCSFSLLAYRNVRHLIRRQVPIVRRRLDRQLTAMILARVIFLVVLGLPYIIYSLCELNIHVNENDYIMLAVTRLIEAIILSLFYANYSINFYIFLSISSRFHHQVKYLLMKKSCHRLFYASRNQVAPIFSQQISTINLN